MALNLVHADVEATVDGVHATIGAGDRRLRQLGGYLAHRPHPRHRRRARRRGLGPAVRRVAGRVRGGLPADRQFLADLAARIAAAGQPLSAGKRFLTVVSAGEVWQFVAGTDVFFITRVATPTGPCSASPAHIDATAAAASLAVAIGGSTGVSIGGAGAYSTTR